MQHYRNVRNKFGAIPTYGLDGVRYDSKFEASVANELHIQKKCGVIIDYEPHYKVEMCLYNACGIKVHSITHKVDFRIHHTNGTFELREAKGVITRDYAFRRKILEKIWLPEHPDHYYTVVTKRS